MKKVFILILSLVGSSLAEARVFNFANLKAASYIKAMGGTSIVHNEAFIHGGGGLDQVTTKDGAVYSFGGEFGFSFDVGAISSRVGIEISRPQKLSEYEVKDSAGDVLYTLDSDIIAFSPALTIEWALTKSGASKAYVFTGGGYSYISLINKYTMTSAGTSAFGKASFIEDAKTQGVFGTIGVGYEMLLVDNVTLCFDIGYRHSEARKFLMRSPSDAISGSYQEGDVLRSTDGTDRRIILSHPFAALLFKFYI